MHGSLVRSTQAPELAEIFSDAATCVVLLRRYLSQAWYTLNGMEEWLKLERTL